MEGPQPFAVPARRSFEEGAKGRNVTKGIPRTQRQAKPAAPESTIASSVGKDVREAQDAAETRAYLASAPPVGQAARKRGGARPGAGRKRLVPEEISHWRFEVNYLCDLVILELTAIQNGKKPPGSALEDLARECPQYQWPRSLTADVEGALRMQGKYHFDRGAGVRRAAQLFVARILGKSASWVRQHRTGRALQSIVVGTLPVLLPPGSDPIGNRRPHDR